MRTRSGVWTIMSAALLTTSLVVAPLRAATCPVPAAQAQAPVWPPPADGPAFDVAHFGEAHYNEGQGWITVPILVQDLISYAPDFVAFSSDMADIGLPDRMECFRSLMEPLVEAQIPWFDAPGNHDRLTIADTFGGVASDGIGPWRETFAVMPAPWGDGPPAGPGFVVPADEPIDGPGASTHYYLDYGPAGDPVLRLIALDNSRHSFTASDVDQYPAVGPGLKDPSQLAFFARAATEAQERGLLTFAMFHEPTRDPRDQTKAHPISYNHTMAKGASADNLVFDALAVATGTDAVLLGHILGNFQYRVDDVRFYIDGGAGGSPYTREETGIDNGYYYAYRLLRLHPTEDGWSFRTYVVPLVDHIEVTSPATASVGEKLTLTATVIQPYDASLPPRFPLMPNAAIRLELRPPSPSLLDGDAVPAVAYMWATSDPDVLRPVPDPDRDPIGDPAFDPATMTTSGRFEAVGAGVASITIATGTHAHAVTIIVD
ncbi:MAG TPA: metallophosphoesterase [Actinomycetota bacterium]